MHMHRYLNTHIALLVDNVILFNFVIICVLRITARSGDQNILKATLRTVIIWSKKSGIYIEGYLERSSRMIEEIRYLYDNETIISTRYLKTKLTH